MSGTTERLDLEGSRRRRQAQQLSLLHFTSSLHFASKSTLYKLTQALLPHKTYNPSPAPMSATPSSSAAPLLPRDARLIALLLAANGAEDCEEGVVRMLVEFAHRKPALSHFEGALVCCTSKRTVQRCRTIADDECEWI